MKTLNEILVEIAARCAAATEGPWYIRTHEKSTVTDIYSESDNNNFFITCWKGRSDAEFISQSRTDTIRLLTALERLLAEVGMSTDIVFYKHCLDKVRKILSEEKE